MSFQGYDVQRSNIHNSADISMSCSIVDSEVLSNSKVYKDCKVFKSMLKEHTFIGDGSKIDNCIFEAYSRAGKYNHLYYSTFGRHTYTGQNTIVMHTQIGSFTSIAWGVTIGAAEHDFSRVTSHTFLYNPYDQLNNGISYYDRFSKDINIGNDVWIGASATILRGVTVGDGSVIGANSLVTKDVPPYSIVAGNPARVIRMRFSDDLINELLEIKWWEFDDDLIRENCSCFSEIPSRKIVTALKKIKMMAEVGVK